MSASLGLSTPAKGSSRRKSLAPWAIARAMNTRLRWPPDRAPTGRRRRSRRSTSSMATSTAARSSAFSRLAGPRPPYRPMATTSSTAMGKSQSTPSFCGTYPTRPRRRADVGSMPRSRTSPVECTAPMMALMRVDLPEPFVPTRPQMRPRSTAKLTPVRARTLP